MSAMACQIASLTIVYSVADQRRHQISASLAFVGGIHRWPVNYPHKGKWRGKCFHLMTSSWTIRVWSYCSQDHCHSDEGRHALMHTPTMLWIHQDLYIVYPMNYDHASLVLLCVAFYPYPSGLLHWHWGHHDCPSAHEVTLKDMGKYITQIHWDHPSLHAELIIYPQHITQQNPA